ncbi:hypothetical protein Q8A73_000454 [Channa argus]|nr:hypothetical protein Q8A73_000454 [Channa argus]
MAGGGHSSTVRMWPSQQQLKQVCDFTQGTEVKTSAILTWFGLVTLDHTSLFLQTHNSISVVGNKTRSPLLFIPGALSFLFPALSAMKAFLCPSCSQAVVLSLPGLLGWSTGFLNTGTEQELAGRY